MAIDKIDIHRANGAKLYRSYDQATASAYDPREYQARLSKNHHETDRLRREKKEARALCAELELQDDQALRLLNGFRDSSARPLTRTSLSEHDLSRLQAKYGPDYATIIQNAAARANELLKDKPTLAEELRRTHGYVHGDVVETVADAIRGGDHLKAHRTEET